MRFRSQSAMEYLMTYGWAVLIIGVVLAALVSLGVFNSALWGPRASAGSCKLFRSTAVTTLEGVCNNVIPQSVAQFNGQNSGVNLIVTSPLNIPQIVTVSMWLLTTQMPSSGTYAPLQMSNLNAGGCNGWAFFLYYFQYNSINWGQRCTNGGVTPTTPIISNVWYNVVGTYDGTTAKEYINGALVTTQAVSVTLINSGPITVGYGSEGSRLAGSMADIQIYNTSLDAKQVQALYMEGIGGVPINLQHIVGWWPLNGDFNDYSGNSNTGAPTSVSFTSSWTSGYTTP